MVDETMSTLFLSIVLLGRIRVWAKGGETILENLQTLCPKCDIGKNILE